MLGIILLSCKHSVEITLPLPLVGEQQYCRRCSDYRLVEESSPSFMVSCKTGQCKLNRSTGTNMTSAFDVARNHVHKMQRHTAVIKNGLRTVAEITNTEETLFATAEQLRVVSADAQQDLKNLGKGTIAA